MDTLLEPLRKNWALLAFVVATVLWYGQINTRLASVEAQQIEQQTVAEKVDVLITDVAVIKEQTKNTNTKADSLSAKLDYLINKSH